MKTRYFLLLMAGLMMTGCVVGSNQNDGTQLTAGIVQREIHKGMHASEVARRLGSPNIVEGKSDGGETWIYDKVSSRVRTRQSSSYGTLLIIGGGSKSASRESSEHTLTVVIDFNENNEVEKFSYHRSKF